MKPTLIGGNDGSAMSNRSSVHHRSRNLSRFSHWLPALETDVFNEGPAAPKGSHDDLTVEFFDSSGDRGRSGSHNSDVSSASGSSAPQRRGRPVMKQGSSLTGGDGKWSLGTRGVGYILPFSKRGDDEEWSHSVAPIPAEELTEAIYVVDDEFG
ncbi:hypothetical protein PanWU01x14_252620 [Parasponia andersonii]|uniref:Uncharacterized protein n=1 Tax=Parasponia andersonii TaxID=3476 RepID=A0A2P5BC01_PARAD|nr:hypothetical protein PanWU01x14_252620 [Parasponia andersonii]